jgi:hypothetical protein
VSPDGTDSGVYFDYLFALAPSRAGVNDGLNTANRYFVYDPDVTGGTKPGKTSGTAGLVVSLGLASVLAVATQL